MIGKTIRKLLVPKFVHDCYNLFSFITIKLRPYLFILYILLFGWLGIFQKLPAQMTCCCGTPHEIIYQGLDFEFNLPPPAGYYSYYPGSFGPWNVTQGIIDHGDPAYCGGLAFGNPNGASAFIDLYGTPATGGAAAGTVVYTLTGLTSGNKYFIEFWYATFTSAGTFSANLRIAGGAWLNVNWTANNPGNSAWLKKTYSFIAQGTSATMSFTDTGPSSPTYYIGMLIDDIRIFECNGDLEKPVIPDPPTDFEVDCLEHLPKPATPLAYDNCDSNLIITFKEIIDSINRCDIKINRSWEYVDHCSNVTIINQTINVHDIDPPIFINRPLNKIVLCDKDFQMEFKQWTNNYGGSSVVDNCSKALLKINNPILKESYCDSTKLVIQATDACGNSANDSAFFKIVDTTVFSIQMEARSINMSCQKNALDSLRDWLKFNGYAIVNKYCQQTQWKHNFNGDSSQTEIEVTFIASDSCGHIDSTTAIFRQFQHPDTLTITDSICGLFYIKRDTFHYNSKYCDSVVIITSYPLKSDTIVVKSLKCNIAIPELDTLHYFNLKGCDSLVYIQYDPQPPIRSVQKVFDCNFNQLIIDSMIFRSTLCDSIVITEKIPLPKDTTTIIRITCDSTRNGDKILHYTNRFGCDSLVIIDEQYVPKKIETKILFDCNIRREFFDTLTFTTPTCDSLIITQHIPSKSDTTFRLLKVCQITDAGIRIENYKNTKQCDSVILVNALYSPPDTTITLRDTCLKSASTTEYFKLKNLSGCDSLIIKEIKFKPTDTIYFNQSTCKNSDAKIDTSLINNGSCDEVHITNTVFVKSDTTISISETCIPSQVGSDTSFFKNIHGCDSINISNLQFKSSEINILLDSITCYNKNDGRLNINNLIDYKFPIHVFLDQKEVQKLPVADLNEGFHTINIIDSLGCVSDTINFQLFNPPPLSIDLGPTIHINSNSDTLVYIQTNTILKNIVWFPILCNGCDTIRFKATKSFWLYCTIKNTFDCQAIDSVLIEVKQSDEIFIPDIFSPNGDNINDIFYILGNEDKIIQNFSIFDRWGETIFRKGDFKANDPFYGWDGTFNGIKLNPGVYIVLIEYTTSLGILKRITSSVTLVY